MSRALYIIFKADHFILAELFKGEKRLISTKGVFH